jgi:hypothetical protein
VVELGVGKEAHKVCRVARLDVVPLQMQRDVAEGDGVAVDVEGADGGARVLAGFFCALDLALEVLREVGGRCVCQLTCTITAQIIPRLGTHRRMISTRPTA